MNIQILGSGCPTCKKLFETVQKIVEQEHINAELTYHSGTKGMQKIIEHGLMSSPVLVINSKVAMVGFTPDISKIKKVIFENLE